MSHIKHTAFLNEEKILIALLEATHYFIRESSKSVSDYDQQQLLLWLINLNDHDVSIKSSSSLTESLYKDYIKYICKDPNNSLTSKAVYRVTGDLRLGLAPLDTKLATNYINDIK